MQIAPLVRRHAGSRQPRSRPGGEPRDTRVVGPELAKVVRGTLEVVADDLVLLQESRNRLDPVGEALMQLGPDLLRQRLVRGVADQQVPEPVGVVSSDLRMVRTDELLPDQRDQLVGYARALLAEPEP